VARGCRRPGADQPLNDEGRADEHRRFDEKLEPHPNGAIAENIAHRFLHRRVRASTGSIAGGIRRR
jgi:hypothetical protein